MKFECTCRCVKELEFEDYDGRPHTFLVNREYQVDEDYSNRCVVFIVYLTGDWHPKVTLSEQEFKEHFEMI